MIRKEVIFTAMKAKEIRSWSAQYATYIKLERRKALSSIMKMTEIECLSFDYFFKDGIMWID